MKKTVVLLLIMLSTSLFGAMEGLHIVKDLPTAMKEGKEKSKNILLFIYSDFCPYCDRMKQETFSDKVLVKYINRNNIFVMENQNSKNLSKKFSTDFMPITYIISYEDGEILQELPGYKSANFLKNILNDCVVE
jgi:thioredoxin-related protein